MNKIIARFLHFMSHAGVVLAAVTALLTLGLYKTSHAAENLSASDLQALVDPIALYPDSLLQPMLAAATFPDQIVDAALFVKTKEDAQLIKDQAWDASVKVVAGYPGVLSMMYQKIDWTTSLGQAFLQQHRDLLATIQAIRQQAKASGELATNDAQKVTTQTTESGAQVVVIEPQNPEVIYVPSDPVYIQDDDNDTALVPIASFGLGLALGAALDDDDDYYYGGGWGGPAYWYDDAPYNKWMDNRRAAWEDHNDRAWDRQDHRQEMQSNRQDFRQDSIRDGTWNPPSTEQRAAMKQNASDRQANRQAGGSGARAGTLPSSQVAGQARGSGQFSRSSGTGSTTQAGQARSSGQLSRNSGTGSAAQARGNWTTGSSQSGKWSNSRSPSSSNRGWSTASSSKTPSRSAFSGYGSRSQVSAYGSRGGASRSSAGLSRGGGGFSRGGGGGGRRR